MSKLIKKYEEFLNENAPAQTETEEETIVKPGKPGGKPGREPDPSIIDPNKAPSVSPDPLARLKDKLEGSERKGNTLYYDGHVIEYPSEFKGTEYESYVSIDGTKVELTKVANYLGYYDVNYDKPELSNVTVGENGELNNFDEPEFDAEYEALKGKNNLKESKSYKETRKFNKRK